MLELGLPTVYTSSSITCGFGPLHAPGGEDGPSEDIRNPIRGTGRVYRETKLAIESMAVDAGAWIVNPDYVVGPGDVGGVGYVGAGTRRPGTVWGDKGDHRNVRGEHHFNQLAHRFVQSTRRIYAHHHRLRARSLCITNGAHDQISGSGT